MLFAEINQELIGWIIATALGSSGVVATAMALYFRFRDQRREIRVKEEKDGRDARREELVIDSDERKYVADLEDHRRQREIDDMREDNTALRKSFSALQDSVSKRIIAAHESHHECEKKYAALEVMFKNSEERVAELEARVKSLEGRT